MKDCVSKAFVLFLLIPLLPLLTLGLLPSPAWSGACNTSTQYTYTFTNHCSYPVWIGQRSTKDGASYPPDSGNWALSAVCTKNGDCASGTCDTNTGQCACSDSSQCTGGAACLSGRCSVSAQFCIPQSWNSGTFWPRTGCTLNTSVTPHTLTCKTGGCFDTTNTGNQLLDCSVNNHGGSPTNPVTQFEVTSSSTILNYDVSIAAGFNVEMYADPVGGGWIVPGTPASDVAACLSAGCTADLNATCPDKLKIYDGATVIGCVDPCRQCDLGSTSLKCTDTFAGESYADCTGHSGSVTYKDMYCAKNTVDGNAQASSNQGTPTAFGASDCIHGTEFFTPTFESGYTLPAGQGVCLYTTNFADPHFQDYRWADYTSGSEVNKTCADYANGTPCGGYLTKIADGHNYGYYTGGLGYTCQKATYEYNSVTRTAYLCMPPITDGLGTCQKATTGGLPLYSAVGGVSNFSWLTAGLVAGNGSVPYYKTFKDACPAAYTWQYDDHSAGFSCDVARKVTNGNNFTGFNVSFCKSGSPFCASKAVKISGIPTEYDSIDEAYVTAASTQTIQARAVTITENVTFNIDKTVALTGGYDCNFSTSAGVSTISGSMTISAGQVTIANVTIK